MQKKHLVIVGIVLALGVGGGLICYGRGRTPENRPHFAHSNLMVTHSNGTTIYFQAEVAITPAEQEYGLMFVDSLPENQAMIFPYDPPRPVAFWMKNTLIPLDMLFVASDGTIGHIAENAQPQDITPIASQIPVKAVIEINGGLVKKDGIEVGDKISSKALP